MKYELTQEQQSIISALENEPVVLIDAKAGCGKTSTSLAVVHYFKPKKGLYTAFNKAIVKEGEEKFPESISCQTKHAFALRYVRPKKKIESFTYLCIKEELDYPEKRQIIQAMDSFFLSKSTDMYEYLEEALEADLAAITCNYIEQMVDDEIPPTFNFLLKYLHILLATKAITIDLDIAILDECQDTTEVFFEIFMLLNAKRKLIVGDPFQNIYGYMNTVNAFNLIEGISPLPLTRTFRCTPEIAGRIQDFGVKNLSKSFKYVGAGTNTVDSSVAYISRTNGSILIRMQELLEIGQTFMLTKPIKELLALPMALANVSNGRPVFHKEYRYLEREYANYTLSGHKSFFKYLRANVKDKELISTLNFMTILASKGINIFALKKEAEAMPVNPNVTIATCHSLKGKEYGTVYIADDLNESTLEIIYNGGPTCKEDMEELNLAYVAISRAKHTLIGCNFA